MQYTSEDLSNVSKTSNRRVARMTHSPRSFLEKKEKSSLLLSSESGSVELELDHYSNVGQVKLMNPNQSVMAQDSSRRSLSTSNN